VEKDVFSSLNFGFNNCAQFRPVLPSL